MTQRIYVKSTLLLGLFTVCLSGLFFHLRFHSVADNPSNFVPAIAGILSLLVVPILFYMKRTLSYGYVLNGMLAIIGAITMVHFSISHLSPEYTLKTLFFKTLFSDILILGGVFFTGKALFDLDTFGYSAEIERKGRFLRYPGYGWWALHLTVISTVYALGNHFWR